MEKIISVGKWVYCSAEGVARVASSVAMAE